MEISDTNPEAQEAVNRLYRQMPEGEKLLRVFDAIRTGRAMAIAGLAMRQRQRKSTCSGCGNGSILAIHYLWKFMDNRYYASKTQKR